MEDRPCVVIGRDVYIGENVKIEPFTIIQDGCIINDGARVSSCVRIEKNSVVGTKSFIGHGVVMRPKTIIGRDCVIGHLTVFEGECRVGMNTLIHAQCHITKGVTIGSNVFIAPLFVGANDPRMCHRRECLDFEIKGYKIEDGARIAVGVTVLPDLTIGRNAFIGAGSVVTRDVPDNAIVLGSPAKVKGLVPHKERL